MSVIFNGVEYIDTDFRGDERMNQLKLHFDQRYDGTWTVCDDNYDYAPDTGPSPAGAGATKCYALLSYFSNCGFDEDAEYELVGD